MSLFTKERFEARVNQMAESGECENHVDIEITLYAEGFKHAHRWLASPGRRESIDTICRRHYRG